MAMSFENFGPRVEGDVDTRMECGICWSIYDPALGDPQSQIAAGTPFSALPQEWRCPVCDAPKSSFMVIADGD